MSEGSGVTDVRDISRLAYGFMASKALFVALDLDLFTQLAQGPRDRQELVRRTGASDAALATLLSALAAVGLVVQRDGRWANAPAAQRFLVTGAREDFADYYRLQIDGLVYPMLQHLAAGVRGDRSGLAAGLAADEMRDPERAARFSRAQHAGSLGPAALLARRVELGHAEHLLDVAGGTGAMTLALCRRFPRLRATIIDFPNVVELAHEYVAAAGMQDRVTLLAGNALDVEWPASDVVLMSYLLSAVSGDHIPLLLDRAATSLAGSGGVLLVHDFMLDDDRLGPDLAALWFLQYLAERVDSVSFTAGELRDQLEHLGYRDLTDQVLIPDITKLVTARWGGPPR